jgi:hypothetical protein
MSSSAHAVAKLPHQTERTRTDFLLVATHMRAVPGVDAELRQGTSKPARTPRGSTHTFQFGPSAEFDVANRGMEIDPAPIGLSPASGNDPARQMQWRAFLRGEAYVWSMSCADVLRRFCFAFECKQPMENTAFLSAYKIQVADNLVTEKRNKDHDGNWNADK